MQSRRKFIKNTALTSLLLTGLPGLLKANNFDFFDDYDEVICRKKFKLFADAGLKSKPIGDAIVEIGKSFIGTDYVAGTLDKNMSESLVVNLSGLDCVTFVENCLTFGRCVKQGNTTFDDYKAELKKLKDFIAKGFYIKIVLKS